MKYMLMIYGNKALWESFPEEECARVIAEHEAFQKELTATGELVGGGGLAFETEAKTVRVRDGVPVVTDGPYLESKEYLGSFYIVDCKDLDRAVELVARLPSARGNGVEVWPILDEAGGTS